MKKSILSQLYHGDLNPSETIVLLHPRFQREEQKAAQQLERLQDALSVQQNNLLEAYLERQSEATCLELELTFTEAFRLGVQMMQEIQNRDVPFRGSISVSISGGDSSD